MPTRILSVSGLRGIVGDGLDPRYVVEFAGALGTLFQGPVVLSSDGRGTGAMLKQAVTAGLTATGCEVLDAGIVATPTCGFLVQSLHAAGGVQITASHNPIEWNGIKPFSCDGAVFSPEWGRKLLALLEQKEMAWKPWSGVASSRSLADPHAGHLERVLSLVDVATIRRRRFRVIVDANHGSGGELSQRLLTALGCDVEILGAAADGRFAHNPEPLEQNLRGVSEVLRQKKAHIAFAQDPDADRLAILDEAGRYIGEEQTLVLCADVVLRDTPGPVVVNGSTSRATADVAARYGVPFHRSYVGEAHVAAKMRAVQAVLGGEGNGGIIHPQVGYVRDSFIGMALVLQGLARRDGALSEWVSELPRYAIVKDKITGKPEQVPAACAALKQRFADARVSEGDGLRLDYEDRWVQVRGSNTEPILRVIAEAPDDATARRLCDDALQVIRAAIPAERGA